MHIRDSIGELAGKTIQAVVITEAGPPSGRYQIHFAFAGGSCFEFFGAAGLQLQVSSRLREGTVDDILASCAGVPDRIRIYR